MAKPIPDLNLSGCIWCDSDGIFVSYCNELDIMTSGQTLEEARRMTWSMLAGYFAAIEALGATDRLDEILDAAAKTRALGQADPDKRDVIEYWSRQKIDVPADRRVVLELPNLPPGTYTVSLRIEDAKARAPQATDDDSRRARRIQEKTRSHEESLLEDLADLDVAKSYIRAALDELESPDGLELLLISLSRVVRARKTARAASKAPSPTAWETFCEVLEEMRANGPVFEPWVEQMLRDEETTRRVNEVFEDPVVAEEQLATARLLGHRTFARQPVPEGEEW